MDKGKRGLTAACIGDCRSDTMQLRPEDIRLIRKTLLFDRLLPFR